MPDSTVMNLPDGRELAFMEIGDPTGTPVVAIHGTPGSRLQMTILTGPVVAAGVRLIAPDRPGYGHSTFHEGRQLADWATDVGHLADHLGLGRFSVFGVSGGGPHAAACARFLGNRIVGAGIVSGVGTLSDPASFHEMDRSVQVLGAMARRSPYLVYPLLGAQAFMSRHWPEKTLQMALRQQSATDAAIIQRPQVRAAFTRTAALASATTSMAAAQDFSLFTRDWGFRLEDIAVPVHVWHGDADRVVPFEQGIQQAASIPGAEFHPCLGEGHLLVFEHLEEILRAVTAS